MKKLIKAASMAGIICLCAVTAPGTGNIFLMCLLQDLGILN